MKITDLEKAFEQRGRAQGDGEPRNLSAEMASGFRDRVTQLAGFNPERLLVRGFCAPPKMEIPHHISGFNFSAHLEGFNFSARMRELATPSFAELERRSARSLTDALRDAEGSFNFITKDLNRL